MYEPTRKDYFAGKALEGYMANSSHDRLITPFPEMCKLCFVIADLMIKVDTTEVIVEETVIIEEVVVINK